MDYKMANIKETEKKYDKETLEKVLNIISEVNKEIPIGDGYDEDARYNYPEREDEIYKRIFNLFN